MNKISRSFILLFALIGTVNMGASQPAPIGSQESEGAYLGQKPPGMVPELFAPHYFGSKYYAFHSSIVFSPDGNEAYGQGRLNRQDPEMGIWVAKFENGLWSEPKPASFSICDKRGLDDFPFMSTDGNKIYFTSYVLGWEIPVYERLG